MSAEKNKQNDPEKKWYHSAWLKRLGIAGFIFFFVKGLIWIAIWFGLYKWIGAE